MGCPSCASGKCTSSCKEESIQEEELQYDADGEVLVDFPHKDCPCVTEKCQCKERVRYYIS